MLTISLRKIMHNNKKEFVIPEIHTYGNFEEITKGGSEITQTDVPIGTEVDDNTTLGDITS